MKECKVPCNECPFSGKGPAGWLGGYKDFSQLHNTLLDVPVFPCHKTMGTEGEKVCKGAVIYMKKHGMRANIAWVHFAMDRVTQKEMGKSPSKKDLIIYHNKYKSKFNG